MTRPVNFTTPAFGSRNKKNDKEIKIETPDGLTTNNHMDLLRRVLQEGLFGNDSTDFEFKEPQVKEKKPKTPEEKEEDALTAFCQNDYTSDPDKPVPKTPTEAQWKLIENVKDFYGKGKPSQEW